MRSELANFSWSFTDRWCYGISVPVNGNINPNTVNIFPVRTALSGGTLTSDGAQYLPFNKTLDDVESLAGRAIIFRDGGSPLTPEDQRGIARDAIVEMLCSDEPASKSNIDGFLVRVGQNAVRVEHGRALREGGIYGTSFGPRASAYWRGFRAVTPDFADDLIETLAVREAWNSLEERHRQTLALYVEHQTVRGAAKAAGTSRTMFHHRLTEARRVFVRHFGGRPSKYVFIAPRRPLAHAA